LLDESELNAAKEDGRIVKREATEAKALKDNMVYEEIGKYVNDSGVIKSRQKEGPVNEC
jgi:hypothetical protein